MKQLLSIAAILFCCCAYTGCSSQDITVSSPSGQIQVTISPGDSGTILYSVQCGTQLVLEPSRLGLVRTDGDFSKKLSIKEIKAPKPVTDSYTVATEKRRVNTCTANSQTITVENADGQTMDIEFRVFDNGVAFRYAFTDTLAEKKVILREVSSFNLPDSAKAWLHPQMNAKTGWSNTQPSYEENYYIGVPVGTVAPEKAGWSFPGLFQIGEKWVLITESGLDPSYCGSRLAQKSPKGEYAIAFAQQGENTTESAPASPEWTLPWSTPWRIIATGSLATIVENTLVTDLALPANFAANYAKPGIASWSWGILKDNSVNYNTQKEFIDYSARMGWPYCLIDVEWDKRIGEPKIQELIQYALSKNVAPILWYNSSGSWNTTVYSPKDKMFDPAIRRAELAKIKGWGVKGIKVDFWPGDGQSAIQYYYDLFKDAAAEGLMVNCHGSTVTRGWTRTFPNLMSMEAVKGFEFTTFEQPNTDKAPVHCTILPFTRNVVGPMDFTPVCFGEIPDRTRRTTNGFEIALSVVFQSGIQHIVTIPSVMSGQPDYVVDFMSRVPAGWDDIKFIDGFPGKYTVIARKAGDKWYVGGINAQDQEQTLTLNLSALNISTPGKIITDGTGNRDFSQSNVTLTEGKYKVTMKPNGGFVLEF